ncbi:hypothetical protein HDC36_001459 [Xanthomonas sp. JAI131]|nr:hypothetical protein [Xanthomonas sp. JAI131]
MLKAAINQRQKSPRLRAMPRSTKQKTFCFGQIAVIQF